MWRFILSLRYLYSYITILARTLNYLATYRYVIIRMLLYYRA